MVSHKSFCNLFLFVIVVFASSGAFAGYIQTQFTEQFVPDRSTVFAFDKYNGPEDLVGIKITMAVEAGDGHFGFDNDSGVIAEIIVDLDITGAISSGDVTLPAIESATTSYYKQTYLQADNGDGRGYSPIMDVDSTAFSTGIFNDSVSVMVDSAYFNEYIGADTFAIDFDVTQWLLITADSGVSSTIIPILAEGSVTVEYLVTPEPVSLALFGLGSLMIHRKRRFSKA